MVGYMEILSQTYLVPLNKLVDRDHDVLVIARDRLDSYFSKYNKTCNSDIFYGCPTQIIGI